MKQRICAIHKRGYNLVDRLGWRASAYLSLAVILVAVILGANTRILAQKLPTAVINKLRLDKESGRLDFSLKAGDAQSSRENKSQRDEPSEMKQSSPSASTSAQPSQGNSEKRGEFVIAPIPVSSPAIGSGLAWVAGYVFQLKREDKISPPSLIGTGGFRTNNGSWALAFGGKFYLREDKYRITLAAGYGDVNVDLYGIGKRAGDRGLSLPFNFTGSGFLGESLFQMRKGLYVGARFQLRRLNGSVNREKASLPERDGMLSDIAREILEAFPDNLLRAQTVSIGPRLQLDTRDNTFAPNKGIFLDGIADFFAEGLGSKFTYQYYKGAFNKYSTLGERQVLAFRAMGCAAAGDRVPIYDLCVFGARNDLRGYTAGRYIDRRMFAMQAEYRLGLPGQSFFSRFGVVAFGGVGGVGRTFTEISISDMLPAGGGGLRFRLTKSHPINFRVDYGRGKSGHTLSIGVGEAF